ncbi:hypothetical protein MFIFM68171_03622 [Madurella fahalii]|uniref:Protein kinase domain-containing protein n=1 Tax=Madurella fahalii TaxID=1157608 RepID=A0ABQ0G6P6_9PEZI
MIEPKNCPALLAPYKAGELLTLRRVDDSSDVKLKIQKPQQSWTLSCSMVVDILSNPNSNNHNGTAHTAFLKLYDWRFASQLRDDQGIEPWTEEFGKQYAGIVLSGNIDGFIERLGDKNFRDETEDDWDAGQNEASLAHEARMMYSSEISVYERLGDIQGTMVPRLIGAVELDITPEDVNPNERQREHFQIKGILLEYIRGFSLSDIISKAPPETWQGIVDQAIRVVHALGDHGVLNKDVRPDNFIVSQCDCNEHSTEFHVFMIDFGQSRLRGDDETDFDWGRDKWQQDEEGAVGLVMQHRLRKVGVEISYVPSYRYLEFAEGEDEE